MNMTHPNSFLHEELDPNGIAFHDETLRDGRQVLVGIPEALSADNMRELLKEYYESLKRLGVALVDVGVPIAGGLDLNIAEELSRLCKDDKDICLTGFTTADIKSIDYTVESLSEACKKGVSILTSPSENHAVKFSQKHPGLKPEEVLRIKDREYLKAIEHAGELLKNGKINRVHVYLEDASRMTSPEELKRLVANIKNYVKAGVTDICLPDTMGVMLPEEYGDLFEEVQNELGDLAKEVFWSAHTHNDFGNALVNALEPAKRGLVQIIEGTFGGNGPGEGIGNADLNTIIHNMIAYNERYPGKYPKLSIKDLSVLKKVNKFAAKILGRKIPKTSQIVGKYAARLTKAGIHQDALYKVSKTIESLTEQLETDPNNLALIEKIENAEKQLLIYTHNLSLYGVELERRFGIADMSGRNGLRGAFEERKIDYNPDKIREMLELVKRVVGVQKHVFTDGQLKCLAFLYRVTENKRSVVCNFDKFSMSNASSQTKISLPIIFNGKDLKLERFASTGGVVSAFTNTLNDFFKEENIDIKSNYKILVEECDDDESGVTRNVIASAEVTIGNHTYTTFAFDNDQDKAGCKAVLSAVNQWLDEKQ